VSEKQIKPVQVHWKHQQVRLLAAKKKLEQAAFLPYDQPDGQDEIVPAVDWAHAAARGIMEDLTTDNSGVGKVLRNCEYESRKDIVERAADIIRAAAPGAEDAKDDKPSV